MTLDEGLLRQAQAAADGWADAQQQASQAKEAYHQTVRRLYLTGASMREIAEALGLSHQRVHQIIETSGGTAGWKPRSGTGLACSFCGATRSDVTYLVAGPGVYICEACVALAHQVVREADEQNRPRTHLDPLPANSGLGCSFCAKTDGRRLVAGPGVRVCDECLEFCAEVIAAQTS